MTNQEIFELMARFDASTATTLKLSTKRLLQRLRASASPPPWWAPSTPPPPPMLLPLCRWATM